VSELELAHEEPLIFCEPGIADWHKRLSIPSERYFSPEILKAEKERLFPRTWVVAGRVTDAPSPGDYFRIDILGEPLLIVCQDDGSHRAFYNICQHRGRRLVDDAKGHSNLFRCIYHNWTYQRSGALKAAPGDECFPDLDCAKVSLPPVRMEIWGGFLFVNLDGKAEPLSDYLGELGRALEGWFLPNVASQREHNVVEIHTNWKLVLDNFFEFYHISGLHSQRTGKIFPDESGYALFRHHAVQVIPMEKQRGWSETRPRDWRQWLGIERSRDCGFGFHWNLFPNISIHVNPHVGSTGFLQIMPHPTDPERSEWRAWRLAMDDQPLATWIDYQVQQDLDNMEPHAAGIRSRSFSAQRLSLHECRVAHFHATVDDYLEGRR
jgi:phenylpropionate dioxygenase-like ring-hydroxylating dioxygenase large terminal subunit